jgi:TldD protein
MKDRLFDALRKGTADYADIRFEHEDATRICYRGREADEVSSSKVRGGIARACTRGGWGIATFDSLDDLARSLAEACASAARVGQDKTQLAEVPPEEVLAPATMQRDFRGVSLDEKLGLAQRYNDILLRTDPAIESTYVQYQDTFRAVHFANSRGTYFYHERPKVEIYLRAVARSGALVQQAYDAARSKTTYNAVLNLEMMAEQIARRAAALLAAPKCEGGTCTVLLDPVLGGVFAHEAFGHLSEADFVYENPRMRELMCIGRPMGVKQLNIVDDGTLGDYLGTHPVDDEGTPMRETYLVRDGVLAGRMHSLETAGKMGEPPTGNARAIDRRFPPIVRMTNTYVANGDQPVEQLLRGIDRGIYACDYIGGQTMAEQFTFSAAYGYRIENGRIGELLRDIVLTGNVFTTLNSIDGFGDDLRMVKRGGGCGKGGQMPLPVTFGSPHLRVRNVIVGGQ